MAEKIRETPSPTGWKKAMARMPLILYRAGLGWLLGGRTDLPLFDVHADPPARLTPGTRVRLVDTP